MKGKIIGNKCSLTSHFEDRQEIIEWTLKTKYLMEQHQVLMSKDCAESKECLPGQCSNSPNRGNSLRLLFGSYSWKRSQEEV